MNISDEIKSKLDIVEVLRDYIPLKAAGVNFRALCPFHREKDPSLIVSPEKQIWHCFGCQKGGDIFSFVMEMEGISFVEALRLLASKAGVKLRRQDPQLTSQRNRLLDIVELASKYYYRNLTESKQAETIRKYLANRGIKKETITHWRIGYSQDSWDDLIKLLFSKGYKENEIFLAGMSVKKGIGRPEVIGAHANESKVSSFYDRFRARIMFPITDIHGAVVGFSARVNPEKEEEEKMGKPTYAKASMGKYINSPQTMIYDKSRILFGLDKAKIEIKKHDLAIIVEGQMDVITAHQNGFKNVVASSGTALTEEQVKLLKRYSNNIALAFDMDAAGEIAAERGIKEAMQEELNIKVIELPKDKDPDECIRQDRETWQKCLKQAKSMMQYYFDKTLVDLDLDKVEDRRQAAKVLLPVIAQLGNKIEQDFWLKKLSQIIDVNENSLRETLAKIVLFKQGKSYKTEEPLTENDRPLSQLNREEILSQLLLSLILKFPNSLEFIINNLHNDHIVGLVNQSLYKNLLIYYNIVIESQEKTEEESQIPLIEYQGFKSWLASNQDKNQSGSNNLLALLDQLALQADKDFYEYSQENAKQEIAKITTVLKRNYLSKRIKEITQLITEVEASFSNHLGDNQLDDKLEDLMKELKSLTDEIKELEK